MKSYFFYEDNDLFVEQTAIANIKEKTPFYCYSKTAIKDKFKAYDTAAKAVGLDYTVCYAIKANYNPHIVGIFAEMGAGADIVSGGELYLARKAGINPEKIVYSGVGKTAEEIDAAISAGILQINIESESEADLIIARSRALGKKANVAVRLNPDVDAGTHQKITTGKKENKFGISFKDAIPLYKKLHDAAEITVAGIDLHIGSQLLSCDPFEKAFQRTLNFIDTLDNMGIHIKNIDVGGGVGIKYSDFNGNNEDNRLVKEYMETVKNAFLARKKKIIFEPGRFLIGNTGILVTSVVHTKQNEAKSFIIVDAGMNDLIRPAMYGAWHEILPVKKDENIKTQTFDIVGPICESSDVFAIDRKIEPQKQGNLLAVMSAGAYGSSMSSNYNLHPLIAEVLVSGKEIKIIRKRQTYEDIFLNY